MRRNVLRLLVIAVVATVLLLAVVSVLNYRYLDGSAFAAGIDRLIERAQAVREMARPEYEREVLAALAPNPTVGAFFRLDDRVAEAAVVQEPVRTAELDTFARVFAYEFDDDGELEPAEGKLVAQVQNGRLALRQSGLDYLRNAQPIAIPKVDIGEIAISMRVRRGKNVRIGWSPEAEPEEPWKNKLTMPLVADGEFHTYLVNTRNKMSRGLEEADRIRFIAIQPSDVEGDEVEIDFIHFLSTRSRYMSKPRDVVYESVGGETRRALYMLPNQTLEYRVSVPAEDPRLDFGAAVVGSGSPVRFIVAVAEGETNTQLHAQTIEDPGTWLDARYDLGRWAGREVVLRLAVEGAVGGVGLWSNPIVSSRPRQAFRAVILIEDALRADHLSVYGYQRPTSPFKERLMAEQGIVFLRARSQDSETRPSVPSMMTSLLPTATGVWKFTDVLSPEFLTLAEVLRSQGFATASFVQNPNAGPYAGLHQGFDTALINDAAPQDLLAGERLWRWLEQHRDRNFFIYLHVADPHGPYAPPPPHDAWYRAAAPGTEPVERDDSLDAAWVEQPTGESRRALYDGEIRHNDAVIEEFVARLRSQQLFDRTLFILTADHGEHFGEHGKWEHQAPGTVQVTGVPLMMTYPARFAGGRRIGESVQLLDVMPTVLELAAVDARPLAMQGDSLVGLIEGRDPALWRDRVVVSKEVLNRYKAKPARNHGLRVHGSFFFRDWHFIASRTFWPERGYWPESLRLRVYDLSTDPQELQPLKRFLPDAYIRYRYMVGLDELQSLNEEAWGRWTDGGRAGQSHQFDPDQLDHLKALGYVQ